jgi:nucleotide-binding universal stress UspA family protein
MKILVPVDFTDVAFDALKYAIQLTKPEDEIVVAHFWTALMSTKEPITFSPGMTREDGVRRELEEMAKQAQSEVNVTRKIKVLLVMSNAVDGVVNELNKKRYDAIVMGTRDKHDLFDKWFGTISLGVIKRSTIPIYLVPKGCVYQDIKSVLVATDYHFESDEVIEKLIDWNDKHKAALKFYHVTSSNDKVLRFRENIIEEFIEKRNMPYSISIDEVSSNNISKAVTDTANKENTDVILIVSDTQTWLDALFFKSLSKDLIMQSKKPIVFLHSLKRKPILKDMPIL